VRLSLRTIPTDASSPEVLGSVHGRPRLCTPTVAVTVARHPVDHRGEVRRKHVSEATEPLRCGRSHRSVRLRFHPAWRLETASTSGLVWPVWCVLPYFSVTRASGGVADALASGASVLRDVRVQVPLRPPSAVGADSCGGRSRDHSRWRPLYYVVLAVGMPCATAGAKSRIVTRDMSMQDPGTRL